MDTSVVEPKTEYAIRTRGLNLWYGDFQALIDVTLNVKPRLITGPTGPSGCGKSSLLRSLNRMNDLIDGLQVNGKIHFEGVNIYNPDLDVIGLRKRMGMVFQKPNPFPMSIAENVTYPLRVDHVRDRHMLAETNERALKARLCGMRLRIV